MNGTQEEERKRFARLAMDLTERTGRAVSLTDVAAEARISLGRMQMIFADDGDLYDAVAEEWFAPLVAMMDDVMTSDLPVRRKMYEFFARRFVLLRDQFRKDPAAFKLYAELGQLHFERARSFVDLADHFLCELIAEAQAEGHFAGLAINEALSLTNQMVTCYVLPIVIVSFEPRLTEAKLARIIDALFDGLSAEDRGASGVSGLREAS